MDSALPLPFSQLRLAAIRENWQQGNYVQVAAYLQEQMEQGSPTPELYWCLGAVQQLLGQELEAQLTWQEGLALLTEVGIPESVAIHRLARGLQEVAEGLWQGGHWLQAATLYQQLLELLEAVEGGEVTFPTGLAMRRIGLTQARSRFWSSAATWFERACQRDPTAAESFFQWGLALFKLGRWQAAVRPLQQATELCPDWAEPWVQLGVVWLDLGDPQQAIACFQAAETRDPLAKGLYSYWVEALIRQGDAKAARERLQRALEAEQEWLRAWWTGAKKTAESLHPLSTALGSLLELQGSGGKGGSQPEDPWLVLYGAWQERLLSPAGSGSGAGALPQSGSEALRPQVWPVPTQGYLTAWAWHQATGEGVYHRLDAAASLQLHPVAWPESSAGRIAGLEGIPSLEQKLRPQRIPLPETFVVEIPQGSVHIGHYPRHLYASFASAVLTRQGELLTDLSPCLPPPEFLDQDYRPDHLQHHPIFDLPSLPAPIRLDQPIALLPLGAVNYFHWMVDVLPALDMLHRAGILNRPIPILIHGYQGKPFQQQTLASLGIPLERILSFEQLGGSHVQAPTLVVPSGVGPVGCLTPRGLEVLRQLVQGSPSLSASRRLYISRRFARWRRVINEAEVLAYLQPLGFVSVQLEKLSLAEQIALMQGAEVVIGLHGAGLTNIAFCRPQTLVIEIFPSNAVLPYFWTIAQVAELRYFPLVAPVCDPALVSLLASPDLDREDVWVQIPELLRVLQQTGLLTSSPAC
ncbi:MAG: glycosyltransferase 61 family protein [Thermostichus sp. DG_1_6_bins_120]